MRTIPQVRGGVNDQWKALIDLQNDHADRRDNQINFIEKQKKLSYLQGIQRVIETNQKQKKEQKNDNKIYTKIQEEQNKIMMFEDKMESDAKARKQRKMREINL